MSCHAGVNFNSPHKIPICSPRIRFSALVLRFNFENCDDHHSRPLVHQQQRQIFRLRKWLCKVWKVIKNRAGGKKPPIVFYWSLRPDVLGQKGFLNDETTISQWTAPRPKYDKTYLKSGRTWAHKTATRVSANSVLSVAIVNAFSTFVDVWIK